MTVYMFLSFGNDFFGFTWLHQLFFIPVCMEVKEIWVEGPTLPVMQPYKCCRNDGDSSTVQICLLDDSFSSSKKQRPSDWCISRLEGAVEVLDGHTPIKLSTH